MIANHPHSKIKEFIAIVAGAIACMDMGIPWVSLLYRV